MLKSTVSALAAGAMLLASTSAFAGSLAPVVVEPAPMAPIAVAPAGSLGGWAPLAGLVAAVAVIALVASDDDDDASTTTLDE